jgi:hypothetical protein
MRFGAQTVASFSILVITMSNTLCLFTAVFLCFAGGLHAQENIKTYVQENTIPLSTISPDSGEDAGLLAIGKAIGDARVVFLGEEDHGERTSTSRGSTAISLTGPALSLLWAANSCTTACICGNHTVSGLLRGKGGRAGWVSPSMTCRSCGPMVLSGGCPFRWSDLYKRHVSV